MLASYIAWTLFNFGLVMVVLAVLMSLIHKVIRYRSCPMSEIIYRWFALFTLGFTGLYAYAMHAFFPDFTAAVIGWAPSPFQFEVAMADLGFGLIGLISFRASYGFRVATVIGNTCWLWGDAVGHINQMITAQNFSIGNAGSWFWLDIFVPLILLICVKNLRPQTP